MKPVLRAEQVSHAVAALLRPEEVTGARLPADEAAGQLDRWRSRLPPASLSLPGGGMDNCPAACSRPEAADTGFEIWLELVEECNLDCLFCYNPWRGRSTPADGAARTLPLQRTVEVLGIICDTVSVSHLTVSGGEPLMYPDLPSLVSRISPAIPSIGITTNGRSGTRTRLEALKSSGVGRLSVPVHSHSPLTHDHLANGRSWHAAVRCLALAQETGYQTTMSAVVTGTNGTHVPRVAEIALLLGIPRLVLNCFHSTGQGLAHDRRLALPAGRFGDIVRDIRDTFGDRLEITVGSPEEHAASDAPMAPAQGGVSRVSRLVLSPQGEIKFCNQSETGLLNVLECGDSRLRALLDELAAGQYDRALASIDNCTCRAAPVVSKAV
ncbi:radical SAM protein [Streptomyces sp. NBC_01142]|uniref:radical SAM protein n=1 Tax=Streptomyces sp. NBC_01142 TaxID=2975865 RepID=UPI00225604FB|nr:radical SAM protein [Streptomyces sp. NBC_01142]MCX4822638.1 radical SAM protein [Streptomyces sp. NBC_01142]